MLRPSGGVLKRIFNPRGKPAPNKPSSSGGGIFGHITSAISKMKRPQTPSAPTAAPTARPRFGGGRAMGMRARMRNRMAEREY